MRRVISGYVGVGTGLPVTCLRESVEIDKPDMEEPRQRGKAVIAGGLGNRQEGLGLYCIAIYGAVGCGNRWVMILLPGAEQEKSGRLRMGDGEWSYLKPSRTDAFFSETFPHRRKVDPSNTESQPRTEYSVY